MNVQGLSVSRHARERFQEHHPDATSRDEIKTYVRYGCKVSGPVIAEALCWGPNHPARRQDPNDPDTQYVVSADRQGIFIIAENKGTGRPRTLVTYLRLGDHHQAWARRAWPTDYEG